MESPESTRKAAIGSPFKYEHKARTVEIGASCGTIGNDPNVAAEVARSICVPGGLRTSFGPLPIKEFTIGRATLRVTVYIPSNVLEGEEETYVSEAKAELIAVAFAAKARASASD